jgi:hypothetical protein
LNRSEPSQSDKEHYEKFTANLTFMMKRLNAFPNIGSKKGYLLLTYILHYIIAPSLDS